MPRIIHLPVSGRDRRAYVRELRRVEELHSRLEKGVRAAYAHAHKMACEEWNARQFLGGPADPSPAIAEAIDAGCVLLEVRCKACRRIDHVDLEEVIWPREKPLHTLARALECRECRKSGHRKRRPDLLRLDTRIPDPEPRRAAK